MPSILGNRHYRWRHKENCVSNTRSEACVCVVELNAASISKAIMTFLSRHITTIFMALIWFSKAKTVLFSRPKWRWGKGKSQTAFAPNKQDKKHMKNTYFWHHSVILDMITMLSFTSRAMNWSQRIKRVRGNGIHTHTKSNDDDDGNENIFNKKKSLHTRSSFNGSYSRNKFLVELIIPCHWLSLSFYLIYWIAHALKFCLVLFIQRRRKNQTFTIRMYFEHCFFLYFASQFKTIDF